MVKYNTVQGDAWDAIALKFYKNENYMHVLLDANPQHNETVIFPANIVLNIPEIETKKTNNFPAWRKRGGRS